MDIHASADVKAKYISRFYDEVHIFLNEVSQEELSRGYGEQFDMWLQAAVLTVIDYDSMLKAALHNHVDVEDSNAIAQTIVDQFSRRTPDQAYAILSSAYSEYKKKWVKENVPATVVKKTKGLWKALIEEEYDDEDNDEQPPSFDEYLEDNGYADNYGLYENFSTFVLKYYCF